MARALTDPTDPQHPLAQLARQFVCVRVTNLDGIDIDRWRFDFDLTFQALTANADGTIYHRYGARPAENPSGWLSLEGFRHFLEKSRQQHSTHTSVTPSRHPRRTIRDLEPYNTQKLKPKKVDCIHCHMVHTAERVEKRHDKTWDREQIWIYPNPDAVGLEFHPVRQNMVTTVAQQSPAWQLLQAGDEVVKIGKTPIATITDIQFALHQHPFAGGELEFTVVRSSSESAAPPLRQSLRVPLKPGWKEGTPLSFAWRPYKWGLLPAPGFGGPRLSEVELKQAGLPPQTHALRVQYIVNWGENRHLGQTATRAGLRQGDIVLTVDGESFESGEHFQSWVRLRRKVGDTLTLEVWRKRGDSTERVHIQLPLVGGVAH